MLRTGPGTAIVGGPSMLLPKCPFMPPFAKMPLKQREAVLRWWANGPIPLLRKVRPHPVQRCGPLKLCMVPLYSTCIEQGYWVANAPKDLVSASAVT